MPCRSDHMEPTARERESLRVLGFHKGVGLLSSHYEIPPYGDTANLDRQTMQLCLWCQENDVTKHSLELQIWWRDHQAADKKRIEREIAERKRKADRDKLISKLTEYERELLGIK